MISLLRALAPSNGLKGFTMKRLKNSGKLSINCRDTLFSTWKVGGKVAGYHKSVGYLELRTMNNAGHLVPMDQGESALTMAKSFVQKATGQ